jgi:protein-S-isoprenylcysteine O-methyltransferase Ste14
MDGSTTGGWLMALPVVPLDHNTSLFPNTVRLFGVLLVILMIILRGDAYDDALYLRALFVVFVISIIASGAVEMIIHRDDFSVWFDTVASLAILCAGMAMVLEYYLPTEDRDNQDDFPD